MRPLAIALVLAITLSAARPALAHDDESRSDSEDFCGAGMLSPDCGWYISGGINIGASLHGDGPRGAGFLAAAEVSLVNLRPNGFWFGWYGDLAADLAGDNTARFTTGPELGYKLVGLDFGYAGEPARDVGPHGYAVRALATVGLLALSVRWVHFADGPDADHAEIGLMFKLPYPLNKKKRRYD